MPHSPEDFRMFVDVKIDRTMGGNNALLYACANSGRSGVDRGRVGEGSSSEGVDQANYMLVRYLIDEAGADPNITNDTH